MLQQLIRRFPDHLSVERAVSGPGLLNLYRAVVDTGRAPPDPEVLQAVERDHVDAPRVIGEAALAGRCQACEAALDLFVGLLGAAAGNLALTTLARSGVFIGGGIAPKILPRLRRGPFLESFAAKGRYRDLMRAVPVRVILEPDTALLGAAREAVQEAK